MEHLADEDRQAIDQATLNDLKKLQTFYEQEYDPFSIEVQEIIQHLVERLNGVLSPQHIKEIEGLEIDEDSLIHFSFMTEEIQEFIEEALAMFGELNKKQ